MNKEEIEKAKIGLWNIRTDCLKIIQYGLSDRQDREGCLKEVTTIDNIFKYINCLEQKESILDKVTDKLKEDIKEFDKLRKSHEMYSPSEERLSSKYFYALKLLKFIEGEKK